ncbi:MAG: HAMP domain-containing histidine kinase [Gammaproteobacteria bacterium]|nr:HAMP domain-containing histidine kinase [Gammaproteobacteria bacterium]
MAHKEGTSGTRLEHQVLALMLMVMHVAVWWDFAEPVSRSLMLAHLGLFLLWQPMWSRDRRLGIPRTLVFILVTISFIAWLNWGLMAFWLLILTGFLGGRVIVGTRDRYAYLLSLVFVVSEILIGCIPPMFDVRTLSDEFREIYRYGMLAVPLVLLFIPPQERTGTTVRPVDFLYGLTTSLLTIVLGLGSLISMYATGAAYAEALIQTILIIAFFLLAISMLWSPLAGFAGIGQLWERYLLSIGTPFEDWLAELAGLARQKQSPQAFMDSAVSLLSELSWIAGAEWRTGERSGSAGKQSKFAFRHESAGTAFIVYTQRPMGVALQLHCKLLLSLITHFRLAKEREQEIAKSAQLQAIHETGARVTHDIKNLLQSLHGLTAMVENVDKTRRAELQTTLRRQLPHLTNRLQLALDKLQAPEDNTISWRKLDAWWSDLKARNAGGEIVFESDIKTSSPIPVDLFDSVVENLLENARAKRHSEPGIEIIARLDADGEHVALSVADTGSGIDADLASTILKAPVNSRSGLGIGLYQAAVQAEQLGYRLKLKENGDSGVRFELSNG